MGSCYSTIGIGIEKGSGGVDKRRLWSKSRDDDSHSLPHSFLDQIGGRMVTNAASNMACLYTQQGKKGTNQDAMLVWESFGSSDTVFCGVFDGHGPYGHMVAKKVRDSLPLILSSQWRVSSMDDQNPLNNVDAETGLPSMDDQCLEEDKEKTPEIYTQLKRSLLQSFKLMDKELELHPTIDCFCSGTTAVTVVKQGQDLVIGNVGDSRAVLAMRNKDNSLVPIQLTVDLKPDLPSEAARIQKCKGRVFALQDEPEVARVWLPHNDSPGLAMARAFGDFCLKDFGLISVPDIYYRRLTERDEFIILASDGVWDVLSNNEAVDIVASAPSRATAARALVDCAVRSWRLKYPASKNDDCAVICLFLENLPASKNTDEAPTVADEKHVEGNDCVDEHHCDEIVPVSESKEETFLQSQSKRSLAEHISVAEDDEWSALEGVTRVNSLLSLPRFLSVDKRSVSWRKWL